jgi:hypothetical protein
LAPIPKLSETGRLRTVTFLTSGNLNYTARTRLLAPPDVLSGSVCAADWLLGPRGAQVRVAVGVAVVAVRVVRSEMGDEGGGRDDIVRARIAIVDLFSY